MINKVLLPTAAASRCLTWTWKPLKQHCVCICTRYVQCMNWKNGTTCSVCNAAYGLKTSLSLLEKIFWFSHFFRDSLAELICLRHHDKTGRYWSTSTWGPPLIFGINLLFTVGNVFMSLPGHSDFWITLHMSMFLRWQILSWFLTG
jgi:hypothetical protein